MGKIAVIGAGMAGLGAALALSRRGHTVTIFERDVPPPPGDAGKSAADAAFFDWQRRGAGQFRHPHAFLGLLCNILQDNYPDLLDELEAAGARAGVAGHPHAALLVEDGRLNAVVGGIIHELDPGDSIRFDPSLPHEWRASEDQRTRIVIIARLPAKEQGDLTSRVAETIGPLAPDPA